MENQQTEASKKTYDSEEIFFMRHDCRQELRGGETDAEIVEIYEKRRARLDEEYENSKKIQAREAMTELLRLRCRRFSVSPPDGASDDELKRLADAGESRARADRARREKELLARQKTEAQARLLLASACPSRHLSAEIHRGENAERDRIVDMIVSQLGNGGGFLVALLGTRGSGKTQMGVDVIRKASLSMITSRYVKALDLFRELRRAYGPDPSESEADIVKTWAGYGLLVIDELQERNGKEFEQNSLRNLIDRRYDECRSTILIANQNKADFAAMAGDSITSRIHETGEAFVCDWTSYRKPGTWRKS